MSYEIKTLTWRCTSKRHIKYRGKPRVSETWQAETGIFGGIVYKAYSTVSGQCFVEMPYFSMLKSGGVTVSSGKRPCQSVQEGKAICEADWQIKMKAHLKAA